MRNISVIVPVYKVEPYLHRCIDSVLTQTYQDYELILVDDGSPDACGEMCDDYALSDDRLLVIHQKNGGLSAARNSGIDYTFACSDSEWISFIDSDDWVSQQYLDILLQSAIANNTSLSICNYCRTENDLENHIIDKIDNKLYETDVFFCKYITQSNIAWGKLYKKVLFNRIRYPLGKTNEDEFVTYKTLFQSDSISYISTPLYFYFRNEEGIMANSGYSFFANKSEALGKRITFLQKQKAVFPRAYMLTVKQYECWLRYSMIVAKNMSKRNELKEQRKKYAKFIKTHPDRYEFKCAKFLHWTIIFFLNNKIEKMDNHPRLKSKIVYLLYGNNE